VKIFRTLTNITKGAFAILTIDKKLLNILGRKLFTLAIKQQNLMVYYQKTKSNYPQVPIP